VTFYCLPLYLLWPTMDFQGAKLHLELHFVFDPNTAKSTNRHKKELKTAFPDWKTKAQQVNTRKWAQFKCQRIILCELPFLLLWWVWGWSWSCWAAHLLAEADVRSWVAVC